MFINVLKVPFRFLRDRLNEVLQIFGFILVKINPADTPEFSVNTLCSLMNIDCVIDIGGNKGQYAL